MIYHTLKYLIGLVFIVSGFVKVIDPIGTAIKLEEYFYVFGQDFTPLFEFFIPYSLGFSVFLCVLEGVLGVALLVDYKPKLTHHILIILILFFSGLTFYSAYFDKVTDCGCFGDALKLTPWQSFSKDFILTVFILIVFLFYKRKRVKNIIRSPKLKFSALAAALIFNVYLAYLGIASLPIIDFRPYHIGANLIESLKPQEVPIVEYEFEKEGEIVKSKTFLSRAEGYKYRSYKVLNAEKTVAKIPDFNILDSAEHDITQAVLTGRKRLIILHKIESFSQADLDKLKMVLENSTDTEVLALTSDTPNFIKLTADLGLKLNYASADETVLKAMIRANPGIMELKDGIVIAKWHLDDF